MLTGKAALPLVVLVGSLIAATFYIKNRSTQVSGSIVPMPMIGEVNGVNREGPWPECVGLSFEECSERIDSYTKDGVEIEMSFERIKPNDFNPKRVVIFVDEDEIVTSIPHKG
mmetsp:Transcript_17770/g.48345  ORF Transcript_17770/g.48345 Transcript_17770/m.48345 type:complete len:113 (+) Transcript_17770:199-537(+)